MTVTMPVETTAAATVFIQPLAVDAIDAAAMIGRRPKTLENWRRMGVGPRYVKTDNSDQAGVIYIVDDLRRWLEERAAATDAARGSAA
ncbi:hypothetical protein GII33_09110 [Gordonia pseudamarae]|jgi:hypothetical protein|uniref:hypothetical protein n=1 Tax=Gordonia TaxID=2053 RepID=UPI00199845AB|nr:MULTISPECIES: hypothetical protein [Gordonia]MBD0021059.1 hypothetical protein [Gordonia sp. (in: high G+C Gram-positive bacteria)]QHN26103.1 hypothetical protein GII33_09110 [Gordonia pseudamarae]